MKAKLLSFVFFSFHFLFGNGTFQKVSAEKEKKISPPPTRVSGCRPRVYQQFHALLFSLSPAVLTGSTISINRNPNIYFRNRKDFVDAIAFCASEAPIVSMI
jgi:hypothetical protein